MEEKQITISESQLKAIVNHCANAILSLSGEVDITASTFHSCTVIKIADEVTGGLISSKDIFGSLQEDIKERAAHEIARLLCNESKPILKLKDDGRN